MLCECVCACPLLDYYMIDLFCCCSRIQKTHCSLSLSSYLFSLFLKRVTMQYVSGSCRVMFPSSQEPSPPTAPVIPSPWKPTTYPTQKSHIRTSLPTEATPQLSVTTATPTTTGRLLAPFGKGSCSTVFYCNPVLTSSLPSIS